MEYTTVNILHHSSPALNSKQNSRTNAKFVEFVKILKLFFCN